MLHGDVISTLQDKLKTQKTKAGIFNGLQIRELINDQSFTNYITVVEKSVWNEFILAMKTFNITRPVLRVQHKH